MLGDSRALKSGAAAMTANVRGAEVPPPGAGVTTVMESVPAAVRSDAGMTAVSCVPPLKVVGMAVPLKSAVEPETKLVPVRVTVVFGLPSVAELGLMLVRVGAAGLGSMMV